MRLAHHTVDVRGLTHYKVEDDLMNVGQRRDEREVVDWPQSSASSKAQTHFLAAAVWFVFTVPRRTSF